MPRVLILLVFYTRSNLDRVLFVLIFSTARWGDPSVRAACLALGLSRDRSDGIPSAPRKATRTEELSVRFPVRYACLRAFIGAVRLGSFVRMLGRPLPAGVLPGTIRRCNLRIVTSPLPLGSLNFEAFPGFYFGSASSLVGRTASSIGPVACAVGSGGTRARRDTARGKHSRARARPISAAVLEGR